MKKISSRIALLICIILTICVFGIAYYNCANVDPPNQIPKFWEANILTSLNVLLFVWITFFVVQRSTDTRKQKEIIQTLLLKLQTVLESPDLQSNEDINRLLMRQREVHSIISALKESCISTAFKSELRYIEEQIQDYELKSSSVLMDKSGFLMNQQDMQRSLNNASNKLISILINLF